MRYAFVAAALVGLLILAGYFTQQRFGAEPPKTDYKFWYIKRDDSGVITEAAVRYYEGSMQVVDVRKLPSDPASTTIKYVRTKRLQEADLTQFSDKEFTKEKSGNDAVIYTPKDFGRISTDEQLRAYLNGELAKDPERTPIDAQKI